MSALRLTALLTICSVAAGNFLVTPQKSNLASARSSLTAAKSEYEAQKRKEEEIKVIPVAERFQAQPVEDSVLALVTSWQRTRADYGIDLRDVSAPSIGAVSASDGRALSEAAQVNPISGLKLLTLNLTGTYTSLAEFQQFMERHIMSSASTVSKITMKSNGFEIVVDVIGT